jgi:hypothetical protein
MRKTTLQPSQLVAASVLVVLSIVLAVLFVHIAATRPLTTLEGTLFQAISLLAGLAGSYLFGTQSAMRIARGMIKPHARSAFRRVLSLYKGLSRIGQQIERAKSAVSPEGQITPYDILEAMVEQQLLTVDDAVEDWRDLVPEEVEELQARLERGEPILRSQS